MGLLKNFLLLAIALYLGVGAALFVFQRSFLYFPTPAQSWAGLADVTLTNGHVHLQGYVGNDGQSRALIYFGGNAEQIGSSLQALVPQLPDTTLIGFNYRGYGDSSGEPTEAALYEDALFLFDALHSRYQHITLVGRSLGSGVASYVAAHRPVDGLVLVTPYDSITSVAAKLYWYYPVRWMIRDRYASVERAAGIHCPVLLLVAGEDKVVPPEHSQRLFDAFSGGNARLRLFPGAEHNAISDDPQYLSAISAFVSATE